MKALILNSGLGHRMGVITKEHPKCMTEISAHNTILSRQLRQLVSFGIKEVVMTIGCRGCEYVRIKVGKEEKQPHY
jgi:phosphoenolpyruvate phosphomutase